jgi:hypothetical protein
MRKSDREKRHATIQLIGLVLVVGLLSALAAWNAQRPADATQLALPLAELRSQSAELAHLQQEYTAGAIDQRFLRSHTRQLQKLNDDTRDELQGLHPWPRLAEMQSAALDDAQLLQQRLDHVAGGGEVDERDIDALRDRFRGRERTLRD